jgi:hypothetical protein
VRTDQIRAIQDRLQFDATGSEKVVNAADVFRKFLSISWAESSLLLAMNQRCSYKPDCRVSDIKK